MRLAYASVAHFDISVFEQPGECIQDRSPKVLVGRHAENTPHIKHILPILLRLLLDLGIAQNNREVPSSRCRLVRYGESVFRGDRVVDVLEGASSNLRGFRNELLGRKLAIQDVRSP